MINTDAPCENGTGSRSTRNAVFLVLAIVSLVLKTLLATQGNNYDIESYSIVADATLAGKSVYAETTRYNYGPAWAYIVSAARYVQIHVLCDDGLGRLHMIIGGMLAYVDVLIALFLLSRFSFAAALIFLLNPVSYLLTGLHSQFDNFAVLLGLWGAWLMFGEETKDADGRRRIAGSVILGLSLVLKHVLIFYPLWLLLRPDVPWKKRLTLCAIPYAVFFGSFLPYVWDPASFDGIVSNVFCYSATSFVGFYQKLVGLLVPVSFFDRIFAWVPVFSGFKFVMLLSILLAGFIFRRVSWRDCFLLSLVSLCVFSSQLADQYLAIPLVACAVYWRCWLAWAYMLLTAGYLLATPDYMAWLPWLEPVSTFFSRFLFARWQPMTFLFIFLLMAMLEVWRKSRARQPITDN